MSPATIHQESAKSWLPVAAAAAETGVSERTLHRWAKERKVPVRVKNGVTLLDVAAVRAKRAAANSATSAATVTSPESGAASADTSDASSEDLPVALATDSGGGGSGGSDGGGGAPQAAEMPPEPDGEIAAEAFEHFAAGATPAQVVIAMRIAPAAAEHLWLDYMRLEGLASEPSIADRVEELEAKIVALHGDLVKVIGAIRTRLAALEQAVAEPPAKNAVYGLLPCHEPDQWCFPPPPPDQE